MRRTGAGNKQGCFRFCSYATRPYANNMPHVVHRDMCGVRNINTRRSARVDYSTYFYTSDSASQQLRSITLERLDHERIAQH